MHTAIIWFMVAKCVADKVNPPEKNCLTLPHKTFSIFKYVGNVHDI